ncbi:FtsX-like permease family protein [Ruminococcus sp. XPD3002]|uniref:FtsX-like permease family protein n=1 Tax=Ruminococcus sp. XPD3002 TaxID=1452269 RepID=UPI00091487BD|nr:putative ABC transport system permease protein [Ruminococcus flavefaciens]
MLFKISLSNIRKSLRDYTIYFFTLIIGVAIFYVFNAIGTQTAFLKVSESTREIIDILKTLLSGMSIFVSFILGLLIVYASRFLMKRRNNEFALYMLLGMGKAKISAILLIETMIIGIASLVCGLLIGTGLSQVMSALVVNLFDADMTAYRFTISGEAIIKTIIFFSIMYAVVMVFNSIVISKCKLINLIQSGRRSEKIKMKNPWLCTFVFIVATALLIWAYLTVNSETIFAKSMNLMIICIIAGAVATLLIFWSVSGLILRLVMSAKKLYFKSLNSFTFRQISSKINTMVVSMTLICLMLFVTIGTLSTAFSIRTSMNESLKTLCNADAEFFGDNIDAKKDFDVVERFREFGFDPVKYFDEYVTVSSNGLSNISIRDTMGEVADTNDSILITALMDMQEEVISLSEYNKAAEFLGNPTFTLDEDQYIIVCDMPTVDEMRNAALSTGIKITVNGHELSPKYKNVQEGYLIISAQHMNVGLIVVPDSVAEGFTETRSYLLGNYPEGDKETIRRTDEALINEYNSKIQGNYEQFVGNDKGLYVGLDTHLMISDSSIGLGAMATFLGLYLGIVFLISSAAVLALKELSETIDSIGRYDMIRKLGADEKEISRSLFAQTGIFFLIPMVLAVIHSVFGIQFAQNLLRAAGISNSISSLVATAIIILVIYGGYFIVTYLCSKSMIKERK